jgi:hypothetical protein
VRSAACYICFTRLLARSYSDTARRPVHQLLVDAYGAQHPGDGARRCVQGVALSLMTLCLFLEDGVDPARGPKLHNEMATRPVFHRLDPPVSRGQMTAADVLAAHDADEHRALVREWARQVWRAWAPHHATVRAWLEKGGY